MTMLIFGCSMILASRTYAAAPTKLTVKAGYERLYISWKGGDGPFTVKVNGKVEKSDVTKNSVKVKFDPFPKKTDGKATKATVEVISSDGLSITQKDVEVAHPMYVIVQTRGSKLKLYPSAKSNTAKVTLGKKAKVIGYGGYREDSANKRIMVRYKGKDYYVKSTETTIKKYVYDSKSRYSKTQVENFFNDRGVKPVNTGSKGHSYGKQAIWVNTYHQRVYLFKWNSKKDKWELHSRYPKGILCNTGKELTPYGKFKITTKWEKKESTGTRWWCIFEGVGIHEKLGDALGKPASGGCVRIPDNDAYWFYWYGIGKGTPILVY
jgi:hypothetical protein